MVDSTLVHNPMDCSLIDVPSWMLDGLEHARRVWHIIVYKPSNKIPLTSADDDFMAQLMSNK